MKRYGNLWDEVTHIDNLFLAHYNARKGKSWQKGIKKVEEDLEKHIYDLQIMLLTNSFLTGEYKQQVIVERGKERLIHILPYYPDRIVHHAVAQVLCPIWKSSMIRHTYSSIPGRGIHDAARILQKQLRQDEESTQYCLKMDIKKFYPSIPHKEMKNCVRKKIKDPKVLDLLDNIIDSISISGPGVGVPIGNYLSQWFANIYLGDLDWKIKQKYKIKYFHRYCDDLILLHNDKNYLHQIKNDIEEYLNKNLKLQVKENWQVFPVNNRGIDFIGYRFWHEKTLIRNSIKKTMKKNINDKNLPSYNGWTNFGSTYNLRQKYIIPLTQ